MRRSSLAPLVALAGSLLGSCEGCNEPLDIPPGSVSIIICNPLTGAPVDGADVRAIEVDGGEQRREASTDADGHVDLLGLPVGAYELRVDGGVFKRVITADVESGGNDLVDTACRPLPAEPGEGVIVGAFCDAHVGGVVKDAVVEVTLVDGTVITATTDENGEVEISVPAGTVTVRVAGNGVTKFFTREVVEGETVVLEQNICLPPDFASLNHITGTVCLAPDDDVSTATVTARWRQDDNDHEATGVMSDDGTFDIAGVGPTPLLNVFVEVKIGNRVRSWNIDLVVGSGQADGVSVDDIPVVGDSDDGVCVPLLPDDNLRYLVVTGQFDSIQSVLFRMELPNVELLEGINGVWAEHLLASKERLARYDAIFVNCGVFEAEWSGPGGLSAIARRNLKDYVDEGGALMVSDHAYDLIEQIYPDEIDFFGDDTVPSGAELSDGGSYDAAVVDADIAASLGVASFPLDFAFTSGAVVDDVAADVDVLLTTDLRLLVAPGDPPTSLPNTPISMGFDHGDGRVVFSAFHQEVVGGSVEAVDGPEDQMLQELVFNVQR